MSVTVLRKKTATVIDSPAVPMLSVHLKLPDPTLDSAAKHYVGVLPANCYPQDITVRINTTFAGGVIMGTSVAGSSNAFLQSLDVTTTTTGSSVVSRGMGYYSTVDLPVYVQTVTTALAAGDFDVWWPFLPASK